MNFKKILLLGVLLIYTISTHAQSARIKKQYDIDKMIWPHNDVAKKIKYDAAKYKDQSAVVIYKKHYYDYKKMLRNVRYEHYYRSRVKILDKAALEYYSEFIYNDEKVKSGYLTHNIKINYGVNYFSVRIIKPNGKIIKINIKKNTVKEDKKNKLAIPNLEIGDIVDYYYYSYKNFFSRNGYTFDKIQTSLNGDYPIIKMDMDLRIQKRFLVNFQNSNGAPDLKKVKSKDPKQNRYILNLENIKPRKAKRYIFPLREYPSIKFQVYFITSSKNKLAVDGFLSKDDTKIKRSVSKEDVFQKLKPTLSKSATSSRYNSKYFSKYKKQSKHYKTKEEKIKHIYEHLNNKVLLILKGKSIEFYEYEYYLTLKNNFLVAIGAYLEKSSIKYDYVVTLPRKIGKIEDLLLYENIEIFVRAHLGNNKFLYLSDYNYDPLFTIAGEINPLLQGNTAYLISSDIKKITKIEIPAPKIDDNIADTKIEASINPDNITKTIVKQNIIAKGAMKKRYQHEYISMFQLEQSEQKPKTSSSKKRKRRWQIEREKREKEKEKEENKKIIKEAKKSTEDLFDFKVDEVTKIDVKSIGNKADNTVFEYSNEFIVKDGLIKKAGRNIILQAGKLYGKQLHIDQKDMDRTENIYKYYPNKNKYTIKITIPEGYKVKGLEHFNKSIKNETGSFVSTAKQEGNNVIIKVEEIYKHIYEQNSNWKKLVDILSESYQFTQEKLLLKK